MSLLKSGFFICMFFWFWYNLNMSNFSEKIGFKRKENPSTKFEQTSVRILSDNLPLINVVVKTDGNDAYLIEDGFNEKSSKFQEEEFFSGEIKFTPEVEETLAKGIKNYSLLKAESIKTLVDENGKHKIEIFYNSIN